jgi:fatty acid/phospholipid biosynthesis enzyme
MATTSKKTTRTARTAKAHVSKPNRSNVVPAAPFVTKTEHVIGMLRRKDGASLAEIMDVLGWKEHSVRALLTATIAKGKGLPLVKSRAPGEPTRYHIAAIRPAKN